MTGAADCEQEFEDGGARLRCVDASRRQRMNQMNRIFSLHFLLTQASLAIVPAKNGVLMPHARSFDSFDWFLLSSNFSAHAGIEPAQRKGNDRPAIL